MNKTRKGCDRLALALNDLMQSPRSIKIIRQRVPTTIGQFSVIFSTMEDAQIFAAS